MTPGTPVLYAWRIADGEAVWFPGIAVALREDKLVIAVCVPNTELALRGLAPQPLGGGLVFVRAPARPGVGDDPTGIGMWAPMPGASDAP